jgi:hypothetical protein
VTYDDGNVLRADDLAVFAAGEHKWLTDAAVDMDLAPDGVAVDFVFLNDRPDAAHHLVGVILLAPVPGFDLLPDLQSAHVAAAGRDCIAMVRAAANCVLPTPPGDIRPVTYARRRR